MMATARYDVFVSYASPDRETARLVHAAFSRAGLAAWFDRRDVRVGRDWAAEIANAIRSSRLILLVLSGSTANSTNVRDELAVARELGKDLVVLRVDSAPMDDAILYWAARPQRLEIPRQELAERVAEVVQAVKERLRDDAPATSVAASASGAPDSAPVARRVRAWGVRIAVGAAAALATWGAWSAMDSSQGWAESTLAEYREELGTRDPLLNIALQGLRENDKGFEKLASDPAKARELFESAYAQLERAIDEVHPNHSHPVHAVVRVSQLRVCVNWKQALELDGTIADHEKQALFDGVAYRYCQSWKKIPEAVEREQRDWLLARRIEITQASGWELPCAN